MSRYTGPVCKLCRREQNKLFLKGARCMSPKCPMDKQGCNFVPGQHGPSRQRKLTQYATQLREKQKCRRVYGVTESVFRKYFAKASRQVGIAGENFLRILERRLDNVVYRLGFATSRNSARQLVAHGNIEVDGRKVDIPSFLVKPGMQIAVRSMRKGNPQVQASVEVARQGHVPAWLVLDEAGNSEKIIASGKVVALPNRSEIGTDVNEQIIVEFYSRMGGK